MFSIDIDRSPASVSVHPRPRAVITSARWRARAAAAAVTVATAIALAAGCLPALPDVQCLEDASCNRSPGGACRPTPAGNRWCAYPDLECPSRYRHSDFEVGDGASGACAAITHDLTVTVEGDGSGLVSAPQGDFTCASGTCTRSFLDGERIDLAAAPSAGAFLGWSQSCQGPGPCELVMDRDRAATALFGTPGHTRWVRQIGGSDWDYGSGIAIDGDGNVVASGTFSRSLKIGNRTLTSSGSYDIFVIKQNGLTGDVIWAQRFGGLNADFGGSVQIDASGSIYITGGFSGDIDFGGGTLRSEGHGDAFLVKLTADGEHVWSRRFGGLGSDSVAGLAVRNDAVAIVGSYAEGTVVSGSGPALLGYSMSDIFAVKLTVDGRIVWQRTMNGSSPRDEGTNIAIDSSGDVVIVGEFGDTMDLGGWPLVANGIRDIFIAKYSGASGAHLFSKRYGGTGADAGRSVAVDASDNILLTGYFNGTANLGGPTPLSAVSDSDIFIAKYTLGGAYLWARSLGAKSPSDEEFRSMALTKTGDIRLVGQFCGTISFGGPDITASVDCSTAEKDLFTASFGSADGSLSRAVRSGGHSSASRVAVGPDGRLYLAGSFESFAELGGRGLTPIGGADAFFLALAPL
jgi:hypothetical protein